MIEMNSGGSGAYPRAWKEKKMRSLRNAICAPRLIFVCLLLSVGRCLALSDSAANHGSLRAGAARVDVTSLADYPEKPTGKYEHEHLYVRAIVLDNGIARAALVGLDAHSIGAKFWKQTAEKISAELNCPIENILLAPTHAHSADVSGSGGSEAPQPTQLETATLDAVRQAKSRLEPARIGFGLGTAYLNANRDALDPKTHEWTQGQDLSGPSDKTVSVVKFIKPSGAPIAAYVSYGMSPPTAYFLGFASGDYPAALSRYVEQAYGDQMVTVFSSSASADQNPLYMRPSTVAMAKMEGVPASGDVMGREPVEAPIRDRKITPKPVDSVDRERVEKLIESEGTLLGEEVIRVMSATKRTSGEIRIQGFESSVSCPGRRRTDKVREGAPGTYVDADPVSIRQGVLGLGEIALAWVNADMGTPLQWQLESLSPMTHTVLVDRANGGAEPGYIPDDEAYSRTSFEVLGSHVKPGCGAVVVDGLADLISQYARGGM